MKYLIPVVVIIALLLSGCGSAAPPSGVPEPGAQGTNELPQGQFGGFSFGGSAEWPDYLPDDIPPIPANITTVMADSNFIRIFFDGLPQNEFEAYLELLKSKGYSLEYIAYQQPYETEEEAKMI